MDKTQPDPESRTEWLTPGKHSNNKISLNQDRNQTQNTDEKDIILQLVEEIFDLEQLQKLQDEFADATRVASIITLPDGTPITRPSNFTCLCNDIIRKSPVGYANCKHSDSVLGGQNTSGPIIARCLSGGLIDGGASITVGGVHIANWLIGQVRFDDVLEETLKAYAREIEVEEKTFLEAYSQVPTMPREQFEKISNFLFNLAKHISQLAYQNTQLVKVNEELKETEEELRASGENYRSYVANASVGIEVTDEVGMILEVNPAITKISGRAEDGLVGSSMIDFAYPDDKGLLHEFFKTIDKEGIGHLEEIRMVQQNKTIHWCSIEGVRITGGRRLIFISDISERILAEIEVRQKREEVEQHFRASLDLLCIADTDGYFRRLNPEWENALGYSIDELVGTRFLDFVHPDDVSTTLEAISQLSANSPVLNFTNRYLHKNGTYRWIEWRSLPVGKMIYASARDITDRIELENKEKESLEKFHAIFGSMVEGCALHEVILGPDGSPENYRLIDVNPAYERIIGMSAEVVCGKLATEVYGTSEPPYLEEFGQVAITGIPQRMTTYFPPLNQHFEISITCPKSGQFATIFSDITRQVKNEEEILRLNQNLEQKVIERTAELEQANKELEAFTYSVSHDLRAPLRSIDGFSQILLEDCSHELSEDGIHYLDRVRTATQQMGILIDDLLRLSRIMRVEMKFSQVNLSHLATLIIQSLQEEDPTRVVKVSIQPDLWVEADSGLISIALENLIRNAWKFSSKKEETLIEVGSIVEQNRIVYFIRDHGAGFDMAFSSKLFGAFQRLHSPEEFEGTGIGLAIVQRIIHRHNGTIWAEGKPGEGATFWFTIHSGG